MTVILDWGLGIMEMHTTSLNSSDGFNGSSAQSSCPLWLCQRAMRMSLSSAPLYQSCTRSLL